MHMHTQRIAVVTLRDAEAAYGKMQTVLTMGLKDHVELKQIVARASKQTQGLLRQELL